MFVTVVAAVAVAELSAAAAAVAEGGMCAMSFPYAQCHLAYRI